MYPQTLFHDAASNIISLVLNSTRYDYEDKTLKEYVQMFRENAKIINGPRATVRHHIIISNIYVCTIWIIFRSSLVTYFVLFSLQIYDTLPVVRYLPLPFKKAFTNAQILKQKAANMINKHKTTRVPGQP